MSVYDFVVKDAQGKDHSLKQYQGQVLLIVNVASRCGFTPQYAGLEKLYKKYKDQGFSVLGFPCNQFGNQEPGDNQEIQTFCKNEYGVTFPVLGKIEVNGPKADPLYVFLKEKAPGILGSEAIKWNFTKFLIDREGQVVERFAPQTTPEQIDDKVAKLLKTSPPLVKDNK